jgi:hypothetical protein
MFSIPQLFFALSAIPQRPLRLKAFDRKVRKDNAKNESDAG